MLPQFDLTFFPSQIFWLMVCFGAFFLFVHFYFVPKIENILSARSGILFKNQKIHELAVNEAKVIEEKHVHMISAAKAEAEAKLKLAQAETKSFIEDNIRKFDSSMSSWLEIKKQEINEELKEFDKMLSSHALKGAQEIISAVSGHTPTEDEIKKKAS